MSNYDPQKEEQWLRLMLNEAVDAKTAQRLHAELGQDFRELERFQEVSSFVSEVGSTLEQAGPDVDLTHDQKTELYAHLTSVFESRRRTLPKEWLPQLKFALMIMFGTATLVASIPLIYGPSLRRNATGLHPDGAVLNYQPPEVRELPERVQPAQAPVTEQNEANRLTLMEEQREDLPYPVLPWEPLNLDFEVPSFDLSEIDLQSSIVNVMEADVRPVPVHRAKPEFPVEARRNRANGVVVVEFVVDEAGSVGAPRVVSSTHMIFDNAALEAIRDWRFNPGEKDGQVVPIRMRVPFVFHHASAR